MKIFQKLKEQKLTIAEKETGRNRLEVFMRENPIRNYTKIPFRWYIISPFHNKILATSVAFVFVFLITGGTSIAARFSLPGDILYPIKISLNEKVESFAAFGVTQKAQVEADHVDTRLVEAEKLETNNKLSESRKTEIEVKFTESLKGTMTHVETLNNQGQNKEAAKVSNKLENSLQKHKEIVDKILEPKLGAKAKSGAIIKAQDKTAANAGILSPTQYSADSKMTIQANSMATTTKSIELKIQAENESGLEDNKIETPLLDETLEKISRNKIDGR